MRTPRERIPLRNAFDPNVRRMTSHSIARARGHDAITRTSRGGCHEGDIIRTMPRGGRCHGGERSKPRAVARTISLRRAPARRVVGSSSERRRAAVVRRIEPKQPTGGGVDDDDDDDDDDGATTEWCHITNGWTDGGLCLSSGQRPSRRTATRGWPFRKPKKWAVMPS